MDLPVRERVEPTLPLGARPHKPPTDASRRGWVARTLGHCVQDRSSARSARDGRPSATRVPRGAARRQPLRGSARQVAGSDPKSRGLQGATPHCRSQLAATRCSAPDEPPQFGLGLLRLVGQPVERGECKPELGDCRLRSLEAEPSEPADHRRLVPRRISAVQRADAEGVVQVDPRELCGGGSYDGEVAGLEGPAEPGVRASPDRHEHMFAGRSKERPAGFAGRVVGPGYCQAIIAPTGRAASPEDDGVSDLSDEELLKTPSTILDPGPRGWPAGRSVQVLRGRSMTAQRLRPLRARPAGCKRIPNERGITGRHGVAGSGEIPRESPANAPFRRTG